MSEKKFAFAAWPLALGLALAPVCTLYPVCTLVCPCINICLFVPFRLVMRESYFVLFVCPILASLVMPPCLSNGIGDPHKDLCSANCLPCQHWCAADAKQCALQ